MKQVLQEFSGGIGGGKRKRREKEREGGGREGGREGGRGSKGEVCNGGTAAFGINPSAPLSSTPLRS